MTSYKLLSELINYLEWYEKETPEPSITIADFSKFLHNKVAAGAAPKDVRFGDKATDAQQLAAELENTIGRLLTYMNRYSRFYVKKALEGTQLQSPEEFTYLALLLTHESMTKTELINKNMQEKTTGTQILKRLIESGLILQTDDPEDKRSKRVSITAQGKGVLYGVFHDMGNVSRLITGNLTMEEKQDLQALLLKLDAFHHPIFESRLIADKTALNVMAEALISGSEDVKP